MTLITNRAVAAVSDASLLLQPAKQKMPANPGGAPALPADLTLEQALTALIELRNRGMSDFNAYATNGANTSNQPLPLAPGQTQIGSFTASNYTSRVTGWMAAFNRLHTALERLLEADAIPTTAFGALTASPAQAAQFRETWIRQQIDALAPLLRDAEQRVHGFSLSIAAHNPAWHRRGPNGEVRPSQQETYFTNLRAALLRLLEDRFRTSYDTQRAAWVVADTARRRFELASDSIIGAGGSPVHVYNHTPPVPPARLVDGVYVLEQGPYTIHIRRDPNGGPNGPWQWGLRSSFFGLVHTWYPASRRFPEPVGAPLNDPNRPHRTAINRILDRLATPQVSHYVASYSGDIPGGGNHTLTVHIRFVPQNPSNPHVGTWQYGIPGGSGEVADNGWRPITEPLPVPPGLAETDPRRKFPELINALFASMRRRFALAPAQFAAERIVVDAEVSRQITAERVDLARWFFNGPLGKMWKVGTRTARIDGTDQQVWVMTVGRCEAEICERRGPSGQVIGYLWRYRFGADGGAANASDWTSWQILPASFHAIPHGDDLNNGRNPGYEGLVEINNRLHHLQLALVAGGPSPTQTIATLREHRTSLYRLARRPLETGPSHDPGENILRLIFGASDTTEYGPGVLRATIGGVNLLFRRWLPAGPGARLQEGYGLWQVALEPSDHSAVPAGGWHLFRLDQAADSGWRSLGGLTGANPPARIMAAVQLLGRLLYSEPWLPPRLHPIVQHLFSTTTTGSQERYNGSLQLGRSILIASGVDGPITNTTGGATADNPYQRPNTAAFELRLVGAVLVTHPHIRMHNGVWQVNVGAGWHDAGTPAALYQLPEPASFSPAAYAAYQRYNQIFTLLGELNRGISADLTAR